MRGERAVAVGLSLTLHASVVGIVIARLAMMAPSLTPRVPITVSFDAPPSIGESVAAAVPQEVQPSAGSDALPAVAPASIEPVSPTPAAPVASPFNDKGAGLELRPLAAATPSQALDGPTPDQPAVPPNAGQALASTLPGVAAKPLAVEHQMAPVAMAADPVLASPLAWKADTLATIPTPQAASEGPPAILKSETAPPSQPTAMTTAPDLQPRSLEILGSTAVLSEAPAAAPPRQILVEALPTAAVAPVGPTAGAAVSVPAPLRASPLSVTEDLRPQPAPDVVQTESPPARHGAEAPAAPMAATVTPREPLIASLAPMQSSTAINVGTTDITVPPTDAEQTQRIRAFVDRYDGGPCFFAAVRRVSASSADIESFSMKPDTFRQFDRALKTSTGVEPTVSGQKVWSAQCPTVDYLRKLPHDADSTPTLDLERRDLDRGNALSGTVHGADGRPLRLFVISETGAVTDVSDALSDHDGTPIFSFRPRSTGSGGPFPQILVLVAGTGTLPLHPMSADDLFKPLMEARGREYSFAAKMFLVTR